MITKQEYIQLPILLFLCTWCLAGVVKCLQMVVLGLIDMSVEPVLCFLQGWYWIGIGMQAPASFLLVIKSRRLRTKMLLIATAFFLGYWICLSIVLTSFIISKIGTKAVSL